MQLKSLAEKLVKDRIIAVPPQVWEEKEYDDTDATRLSKDSETACMCCARPECVRIFVTQTCMTLHMGYTSSAVHNLLRHGRNRLVVTIHSNRVPDEEEMILKRLGFIFLAYRVDYW